MAERRAAHSGVDDPTRSAFVVIPVYNEGTRIVGLLQELGREVPLDRVVVVDDGSQPAVDRALVGEAQLLRHAINLGKGLALRTGCEHALAQGAAAIVLMDGDGQHEPRDLPRLLRALDEVDIAFGARDLGWKVPWVRLAGNRLVNAWTHALFGLDLHDIWCGYRAFRAEAFPVLAWNASDYAADVEMAVRAGRAQLRYCEVPIGAIYHDAYKGVTVLDGLRLLVRLFAWRLTL
jgi:glycosyltransferase involved in cell wall biosynthesis